MTDNKDYTRRNRFNGKSVELTKEQADLHDQVFYHEALEQWDEMLKAKDKFSQKAWAHTRCSAIKRPPAFVLLVRFVRVHPSGLSKARADALTENVG